MRVAFQMDPIEDVSIEGDSSFRLIEEAQSRGHEVFCYTPDQLRYQTGAIAARGRSVTVRRVAGDHVSFGDWELRDLAKDVDVVWLRQDPPFDMAYITTTHLLDRLADDTLVLNNPFWVRNYPEKLMVLDFPDLTPPTMIASDLQALRDFQAEHGTMIVKPLYGNGGAGVFKIPEGGANLASLHELFAAHSREPLIAQKFLPAVAQGDKRIILVDGAPVGAINRVPAAGETRSNMHVGGQAVPTTLTERDREICSIIGPRLHETGQVFVGIDVIGDYLTEINLTSPTGIQELERFDGENIAAKVWEAVERRAS